MRPTKFLLWIVVVISVLATWAPYFGAFDELAWVGPLPFALAWVLSFNVVLTACAVAMYFVHFRPLNRRLASDPLPVPTDEPR